MHAIFYGHQEAKLCGLKCLWSSLWAPTHRSNTIIVVQRSQCWCGEESDQKAEELASARNCLPNAVCVHPACPFTNRRASTSCPGMKIPDKSPSPLPFGSLCLVVFLEPLTPSSWSLIQKSSFRSFGCFSVEVNKYFLFNYFCLLSCFSY